VYELSRKLYGIGIDLDSKEKEAKMADNLGSMLMCFGEIEHDPQYGLRIPPDTEEEKRAKLVYQELLKKFEEAVKESQETGEPLEVEKPKEIEPKKPVLTLIHPISITDLKFSIQKMFEYDKVLFEVGIQKYDIRKEQSFMSMLTKQYKKKFYDEEEPY